MNLIMCDVGAKQLSANFSTKTLGEGRRILINYFIICFLHFYTATGAFCIAKLAGNGSG
jgi:hypothetical protein